MGSDYQVPVFFQTAVHFLFIPLTLVFLSSDYSSSFAQTGHSIATYTYKTAGDCELKADVYRIMDDNVHPAILWIHGGALIFGSRHWLKSEQCNFYLQAGYNVISIDYRLAPETPLDEIIRDLQDAWAWIRLRGPELFNIDPQKMAVVGHSAGGYLTLMAGICLEPKPGALISFYGYGNISGDWYAAPDPFYRQGRLISREEAFSVISDSVVCSTPGEDQWKPRLNLFYIYCRQQGLWPLLVTGHDPRKESRWFDQYEPLPQITADYPPTLLLHGRVDTDVPFEQSEKMYAALNLAGVPCRFIEQSDWGHGFDGAGLKNEAVGKAFDQVHLFLDKYVK
jgi:acetyl esterase/lipase